MQLGSQVSGGVKAGNGMKAFAQKVCEACGKSVQGSERSAPLRSWQEVRGQKRRRVGVLAAGTLVSQLGEDLASSGEGAPDLQKRSWGRGAG